MISPLVAVNTQGGISSAQFKTFDRLETELLNAAIGSTATLWGPTDWVGTWRKVGASALRMEGLLRLWAADADTFTIGTDGSGSNIERFDTADAPTWETPDSSSGGLVLNGSGAIILPCLGEFTANSLMLAARTVPTLTTVVNDSGWGIAAMALSRTKALGGAAAYSTSAWYRRYVLMNTAPTITFGGGATANTDMPGMASSDEVLLHYFAATGHGDTNYGSFSAGSYRGDESPSSIGQHVGANTTSTISGATDQEVALHAANGAGGDISIRFHEIFVGHMRQAA